MREEELAGIEARYAAASLADEWNGTYSDPVQYLSDNFVVQFDELTRQLRLHFVCRATTRCWLTVVAIVLDPAANNSAGHSSGACGSGFPIAFTNLVAEQTTSHATNDCAGISASIAGRR